MDSTKDLSELKSRLGISSTPKEFKDSGVNVAALLSSLESVLSPPVLTIKYEIDSKSYFGEGFWGGTFFMKFSDRSVLTLKLIKKDGRGSYQIPFDSKIVLVRIDGKPIYACQ